MTNKVGGTKKKAKRDPSVAQLRQQLAESKQALAEKQRELDEARDVSSKIAQSASALEEISIQSTDSKNRPVVRNYEFDASDDKVGQFSPREIVVDNDGNQSMDGGLIDTVDKPITKDKMAALAFNEEKLLVVVHQSTNANDIPIPCVQNDGRSQYFIRGQKQWVKRKFVEILARCKHTSYDQELYKDAAGNDAYRYPSNTNLMYPFSVLQDPNPKGRDWLERILAEA